MLHDVQKNNLEIGNFIFLLQVKIGIYLHQCELIGFSLESYKYLFGASTLGYILLFFGSFGDNK